MNEEDLSFPDLPLSRPLRNRLPALTGAMRQLASVRGIVLDDGPERGTHALAFSTGGGLDFWVLSDRTMDIGPLWHRGVPLAWQHPSGFIAPGLHASSGDRGTGIERSLSGFLVTCGLDNVRQPQDGAPLHGSLPLTPARITSRGEDWRAATPCVFAEGEIVQAHLSGACFRLIRRIEAPVGGRRLRILDRVDNIGPEPAATRILYHFNFGFPAVEEGTEIDLDGREIFAAGGPGAGAPQVTCHRSQAAGRFRAQLRRPARGAWTGISVAIEGPVASLPFVQIWSDPRPRRNILAIEPANCERLETGESGEGQVLDPGQSWTADLEIRVSDASA